jgi:hypothetical protein
LLAAATAAADAQSRRVSRGIRYTGYSPSVTFTVPEWLPRQVATDKAPITSAPVNDIDAYAQHVGKFVGRHKPIASVFHAGAASASGFVKSTQRIRLPIQQT